MTTGQNASGAKRPYQRPSLSSFGAMRIATQSGSQPNTEGSGVGNMDRMA